MPYAGKLVTGALLALSLGLGACATTVGRSSVGATVQSSQDTTSGLPPTPGEIASRHGYVPLDPLSVDLGSCPPGEVAFPTLERLPDLAVRFAVADLDASAEGSFGASKVTSKGGSYRAILDYVNVDNIPVEFRIRGVLTPDASGASHYWSPSESPPAGRRIEAYEAERFSPEKPYPEDEGWDAVTVPVYVGVGLRLYADILAIEGGVTLSGLGVIGAEASAGKLAGTLTVQTLGITGKSIAVALPLPNRLDQTTIEAAILSIGSSRALMYSSEANDVITITPRIVGLYSPVGSDARLINAIYSELARDRPKWSPTCRAAVRP